MKSKKKKSRKLTEQIIINHKVFWIHSRSEYFFKQITSLIIVSDLSQFYCLNGYEITIKMCVVFMFFYFCSFFRFYISIKINILIIIQKKMGLITNQTPISMGFQRLL